MKGLRIAVVAIAVLIVVGVGVALISSGGDSRRPRRTKDRPVVQQTVPIEQATSTAPVRNTGKADPQAVEQAIRSAIKNPPGFNANAEQQKIDNISAQVRSAMRSGEFDKAVELLHEKNRSAVRLMKLSDTGYIYLDIARANFRAGDYDKTAKDLDSVLMMAAVGRNEADPKIADDVEVMRAAVQAMQGDVAKAKETLQRARSMRETAEGANDPSMYEINALEGLLEDLQGNTAAADAKLDEAVARMAQARANADTKYMLEDNLWIFEQSLRTRMEKKGKDAPETKHAQERLTTAQEKAAEVQ